MFSVLITLFGVYKVKTNNCSLTSKNIRDNTYVLHLCLPTTLIFIEMFVFIPKISPLSSKLSPWAKEELELLNNR